MGSQSLSRSQSQSKSQELEPHFDKVFTLGLNSSHSFDLYGEKKASTIVYFKNDTIRKSFHIEDSGVSLRINEDGKTGFSGSSLAVCDAENLIHDASPHDIPSDDIHLNFPKIEQRHTKGIYDPDIAGISLEKIREYIQSVVASASLENITSIDGYVRLFSKEWIIGNSQGEKTSVEETYIKVMVRTYARLLFKNAVNVEYLDGRRLDQIDPVYLGKSCAEKTVKSLNFKKMEVVELPVVLDPSLVSNLMYSLATGMLNAGSVLRKVSCLDLNSRIGSLTLYDDGTIPGGLRSSPVDGEGITKKKYCLIDKGKVKTYLHNLATSDTFKVAPTGNSTRMGYTVQPVIAPSNLIVEPGSFHSQEIIEDTQKGIYYGLSFDVPNMTNGDYFLTAQNAFWIEHGEITEPVRFPGINTTLFELCDNVDMVSKDTIVLNGVVTPTLRLSKMRVFPSPFVYSGSTLW